MRLGAGSRWAEAKGWDLGEVNYTDRKVGGPRWVYGFVGVGHAAVYPSEDLTKGKEHTRRWGGGRQGWQHTASDPSFWSGKTYSSSIY